MKEEKSWFCLRAKPKHEHLAAEHLQTNLGLEVFAPRVRFRRLTRRGAVWVTEPLFPAYLFARYAPNEFARAVCYSPGITGVVHFGSRCPAIPEGNIAELRQLYGQETVHVLDQVPQPGDSVELAGGAFHGLQAVVQRVMPARQRVAVLLDFLGRQTMVDVNLAQVVKEN